MVNSNLSLNSNFFFQIGLRLYQTSKDTTIDSCCRSNSNFHFITASNMNAFKPNQGYCYKAFILLAASKQNFADE